MKNILVLAYAISPTRGSEYSVAWNYVKHMSQYNRLTVLFGLGGDHMGDFDEMQDCIKQSPFPNVRFIPISPSRLANSLNWMNRHNMFVYTFYWAYQVWHKQAYKKALELTKEEQYDLIHYLGPIGYREPGYLWKIGIPYMWGPINGAGIYPWVLFKNLSLSVKLKFGFRNIANIIQLHTKTRIREAMAKTDLLLAATTENRDIFKSVYGVECGYLPENCLTEPAVLNNNKFDYLSDKINLIFVGSLDYRKNLTMLLRALQLVDKKEKLHLDVVGNGPLFRMLKDQTNEFKLGEVVTFHGQLPRTEAVEKFKNAHLHIITSLGEGNPTTIWEAISHGVPTLTLDHCGMHDTVKYATGYKVPVSNNYYEMVKCIADILNHIISKPEELKEKSIAVMEDSENYLWNDRVKFFEHCYAECIKKHKVAK